MSIQYHILSLLKLNAFFWHLQLQCISIVWHPDASHLLYMKTNDGFSIEEVSGRCSFEDAISSLLTWPYTSPHLCVTDRLCREFDPGGMHPVSSRHPAQGVTHQICHQGSIFWSKCASFLIDFQDNNKINQAGQQGLLQGVHFKRHSKGNYLEWDFNWENCVQYFILTKSIKSVDTEKKRPPSEEASVKRS